MTKKDHAQKNIDQRLKYSVAQRAPWDARIHDALIERLETHQTIALYASFNGEVDMYGVMESLMWDPDKRICVPRVEGLDLKFYQIRSFEDLKPGLWGILEPTTEIQVEPETIDVVIVPLAAFNDACYRIGYGGGYYDRFLRGRSVLKIGVAYSFQHIDVNFQEEHDVPCDVIITESNIYSHEFK